jgi:hypothetical protein
MKSIAKILLVGAVAVMAIAVSAAPSEAAKKKRMKPGTYIGQVCSTCGKKDNTCKVSMWTHEKKWAPAMFPTCVKPACPAAC